MKTISISMSNQCIQDPQCFFCYQQNYSDMQYDRYEIWRSLGKIRDEELKKGDDVTIAFEYNGYNINFISLSLPFFTTSVIKTVTTMPQAINNIVAGYLKNNTVESIALSYDSEKINSADDWIYKGLMIKDENLHLACNYLIERIPFEIPKSVMQLSDQINLLSCKPNAPLSNKEKNFLVNYLDKIKSYSTEPTLDNALGIQLDYEEQCRRGKDFWHIQPDGTITSCCFGNQCFLYKE